MQLTIIVFNESVQRLHKIDPAYLLDYMNLLRWRLVRSALFRLGDAQ